MRDWSAGDAAGLWWRGHQLHHARPRDRGVVQSRCLVGWTVLIGNNNCYHAGYLPQASATEIFGADANVIVAGSGFARHVVAKPVRGGYRLTGRWGVASS